MLREPNATPVQVVPWYYTRVMVFIFLFAVAGALALPLLWLSPAFRAGEKIFWSIVAVVYTAIAVALIVIMFLYMWHLWKSLAF